MSLDIAVEFQAHGQDLGALREAAYRIMPLASCRIDAGGLTHICHLSPKAKADPDQLKQHFLDLVTDENLRAQIAEATSRTRDVILALAFGGLVAAEDRGDS